MGRTAFSGPLYGAKGTLWTYGRRAVSSGNSTFVTLVVPAYEDWYATELIALASSGASTGVMSFQVNGSTLLTFTPAGSTVASTVATFTADAGEFEGTRIQAGSTIHVAGAGSTVSYGGVSLTLKGFTRYIPSTRG